MDDDGRNAQQGEENDVVVVHPPPDPVASDVSAEPASLSHPDHNIQSISQSLSSSLNPEPRPPSTSSTTNQTNKSRRRSLPFTFPPLFFQPNTSSTSLAPSTAEGKPIPLDDTTAAHRISALKKLNSSFPSAVSRGPTYPKSTGAQSSTYSQPVLVRTYSGPSPSQASYGVHSPRQQSRSSRYRPPSSSRGVSRRVPLPLSSKSGSNLSGRPIKPALSGGVGLGTGSDRSNTGTHPSSANVVTMPHHKPKKSGSGKLPLSWQWQTSSSRREHDEAKLPPLEAFSFKSFMADMQAQGGENDIGADLDRIAEICARSRYSLSSQYEMHVAPHGSGVSFVGGGSGGLGSTGSRRRGHTHSGGGGGGPTLQAISSDDDESARSHRKRRSAGRRRSVAYGTLETIMSSSRSSEEDKTKKKPAAEIVGEVRGRAANKTWDNSTGSGSTSTTPGEVGATGQGSTDTHPSSAGRLARKKSASFATAVIDSSRNHHHHHGQNHTPSVARSTPSALVSEPARPQTSTSHLGVRTAPGYSENNPQPPSRTNSPPSPTAEQQIEVHLADELPHHDEHQEPRTSTGSVHSGWSTWITWGGGGARGNIPEGAGGGFIAGGGGSGGNNAAGSLRQLLRSVDGAGLAQQQDRAKGKVVDREGG